MNDELQKLIEKGEMARERDDLETALVSFDKAIIEALKSSNYETAVNVLGHRLLLFDKLYKQTNNPAFLEMMYMDAQTGLRLAEKNNLHGQPLALMQMRTAEYYLDTKDFVQAESGYQKAYDELNRDLHVTKEEKAEYLGHLAEAVICSGDIQRAEKLFMEACELLEEHSNKLRDFHKLIIQTGLLLRESNGLYLNHEIDKAKAKLLEAEPLVLELKNIHNMDARYNQWCELNSKINS